MIVFRDNTIIQPDGYTQLPVTQLCYDKETLTATESHIHCDIHARMIGEQKWTETAYDELYNVWSQLFKHTV